MFLATHVQGYIFLLYHAHISRKRALLTRLSRQIKSYTFATSADPDEIARNEPYRLDLHCLPFFTDVLFAIIGMSKFKAGIVHFRNAGMKGLNYKILI